MNILINSSVCKPHTADPRYQGIERLCREYALELTRLGHKVTITAPAGSEYPDSIEVIEVLTGGADAERQSFPEWQPRLPEFDVIHDFSHLHTPALTTQGLPALNVFWHDPYIAQFHEPQYNVIALSQYGADAFEKFYGQPARHQETIIVDLDVYKPEPYSNRSGFLSLGLMAPLKGHLEAMRLCRKLGVHLTVMGGTMPSDSKEYGDWVRSLCNGHLLEFVGDVYDDVKIFHMQTARALIYPQGQLEIHSHKSIEAMACDCPVITYNKGAMKEVIGYGGWVVDSEEEFIQAMTGKLGTLPASPRAWASKWDIHNIVADYIPLYEEVANGLRW